MSLQLLCLICDERVEAGRQGNLVTGDGALRERLEKVVGSGLDSSPRCVSLCENCENSIGTIEEYYRHVENFRSTFASTLAKYGETLLGSQTNKSGDIESEPTQEVQRYEGEEGGGDVDGQDGGGGGGVSGPTWTICLQAEDGSLVPIQQGGPLVMADDHQVVLETVTVESSETQHQVVVEEEEPQSGGNHGDYGEAEGTADNMILHPSIVDHTGMALTNQSTVEGNTEEMEIEVLPKPLFTCARCGAQFEQAEDLVTHERNEGHLGGYNYKCGVCGNIYARLDSLRDHMCRHTGQKPHQCGLCGERFSFRNQLSRHRTSHYQNQAPYPASADQHRAAPQGLISAATPGKDGEGLTVQLVEGPHTDTGEAVGAGKALVMSEDISSQLQSMLNSTELQLVQMNSGELQLVSKQFDNGDTNLACPKCGESFTTRFLLQRHQCPSLSQNALCQFECPKCSATFIKRSFLERHRCPSLFYPPQKTDDITPEPAETPTGTNEVSNPPEQNENESLLTIPNDDTQVTENIDSDTAKSDQVAMTDDAAQDLDTKEPAEDSVEVTLKIDVDSPYIYESTDIPDKTTTDTQETEDVNTVVEDVGEPVKVEEGTGSETPSTGFRRSIRAAGKVNPILEMLKKKSGIKVDKTDIEQSVGVVTKTKAEADANKGQVTQHSTTVHDDRGVSAPRTVEGLLPCVKRKRGRPRKIQLQDSPCTPTTAAPGALTTKPTAPRQTTSEPPTPKQAKSDPTSPDLITSEPDSPETDTTKRGRGRPPKKRGPGRPRKYPLPNLNPSASHESQDGMNVAPVKRKRGRPRKIPLPEDRDESFREDNETDVSREEPQESPPKKKRGRPKKTAVKEYDADFNPDDAGLQEEKVLNETSEKQDIENGRPKRTIKKKVLLDHVEEESESDKELEEDKKEQDETEQEQDKKEETVVIIQPMEETNQEEDDEENFVPLPKKQQGTRRDFQKVRTDFKCVECERYFSTLVALEKHKETAIHKRGLNTPENRKFKCNVCGRGFTKLENLRDHGVNHSSEMRYQCVVCLKKFKFRSQLALHRKRVHSTGVVREAMRKNPHCRPRERYKNSHLPPGDEQDDPKYQPEIVSMMDGDTNSNLYRCKNCLQMFTEMRLFNRHIVSHYSVKPFKCDICSKEFARADTLRTHTKVHYFNFGQAADNKVFLCDTCGRQFTKVESLRNHVKMHFGERAWTCEDCGKGFVDKYTLSRHVVIHKTEKPWLCATCGRGFNRRSHLEAHEAQHTGKTLYKCEICQRGFSDQGNLGRHMLVHSDARPFACSVCGDTFKRKGNLDEHELTHNTERGAVCDVCGARFTTKRYLRIHQLIHSGDRPHQCTVCKASFRQLSALITHKRIHTGDAPYKCQHCDKKFKYYDQWKAHEYSHMDAKPYKCMLCSATYRQAGSLRQHRKVVHGNQKTMLFLCTVCNKTFASTMSLERHMKKVHGAEAALQSLQAIGQDMMATTSANDTSNIVQITNPQGTIETIELTNLPTDGTAATNIVQLLSGQALGSLHTVGGQTGVQVTVGGQSGVQFTQGHRIVQLVGGLDTTAQVVQVPEGGGGGGAGGEVISIDSMGNITNSTVTASPAGLPEGDGALQYDPSTQHTLVHITNGQHVFVDAAGSDIDQTTTQNTDDDMRDALSASPEQVPEEAPEGEEAGQEVQTLGVDADTNQLSVVSITPHQLAQINTAVAQHQVISTPSLVPLGIEVVPIDTTTTTTTTMTTTQHHQLVTMETTQDTADTMQQLDVQAADVIQDGGHVIHVGSDVIHEEGDVIHTGSDIIHVEGDIIHTGSVQSDVVYEGSDVIYTGSDIIHVGSDVMHDNGDIITETVTHELTEQEVVETVSIATSYDHVPGM